MDEALNSHRANFTCYRVVCDYCGKSGHTKKDYRKRARDLRDHSITAHATMTQQHARTDIVCFLCGKKGHIARNYPNKQNNTISTTVISGKTKQVSFMVDVRDLTYDTYRSTFFEDTDSEDEEDDTNNSSTISSSELMLSLVR